jgi:hypothetical protein
MQNETLYSVTIHEKIIEPNVIEKYFIYRFLSIFDAFDYAKNNIKKENIFEIDIVKINGSNIEHLITFSKNKNEKSNLF